MPYFFLVTIIAFSIAEVESSRTSLASRTDFEVLGLGLEGQVLGLGFEASSPRKLACPRLEDSSIFLIVKISWSARKIFWKTSFGGDRLKNFCEDLFFFFFWRAFAFVSLVLRFEHSCPWPREVLSTERLSLALASDFFVSLASSLVSSTPPLQYRSTRDHGNADCLSRLPINLCSHVVGEELPDEIDLFYNSHLELLPDTQESIANSTRKD